MSLNNISVVTAHFFQFCMISALIFIHILWPLHNSLGHYFQNYDVCSFFFSLLFNTYHLCTLASPYFMRMLGLLGNELEWDTESDSFYHVYPIMVGTQFYTLVKNQIDISKNSRVGEKCNPSQAKNKQQKLSESNFWGVWKLTKICSNQENI